MEAVYKICKKCNQEKPISEFRICRLYKGMLQGSYVRSECVLCEQKASLQLREAKKTAPPRPENCDCCGKKSKILVPDHDHKTGLFRGWICRNCNQGIGKLGDNLSGLKKAINYLKATKKNNKVEVPDKQLRFDFNEEG